MIINIYTSWEQVLDSFLPQRAKGFFRPHCIHNFSISGGIIGQILTGCETHTNRTLEERLNNSDLPAEGCLSGDNLMNIKCNINATHEQFYLQSV